MKKSGKSKIRITSGLYRGREISVPATTHSMGSRERLALFNSISYLLPGADVLDCFAGAGSLGTEALSRGANSVVFVEKNPKAAAVINDNLNSLGITNATIVKKTTKSYHSSRTFQIIFADPPYDDFKEAEFAHLPQLLAPNGHLILSHPGTFTPNFPSLKHLSTKKYAACHISLFTKE
ncbi:RsmD family RNA methyltransferase [Candidatus Saccharibacteria bacterium]|nr:RsmD family RNA methyltransferase [Candidatus Saccharibacteria bacterium]